LTLPVVEREYDDSVSETVYLDICSFKRPFDDASVERVRREAEAVAAILDAAQAGRFRLVRSPAHDFENERNPREDRRLATRLWLDAATRSVTANEAATARARELSAHGFGPLDALHLAFAEQSAARWFVTTDDRLLKRASRQRERLRVDVLRPDQVPLEVGGQHA
jgi:predicted nucleic acid-binding protein